jgi:ATP-dependent RNA helicase RhlE
MAFNIPDLGAHILKAIRETGYTEPTPIQAAAIPQILDGHDLIGIAQTGTGKTAAFTLPVLVRLSARAVSSRARNGFGRGTRALMIAPTRELTAQMEENVRVYAKTPFPARRHRFWWRR